MKLIQYTKAPPYEDEWVNYDLPADLEAKVLNMAPGEVLRIPDVGGLPTFILNQPWRTYDMYQKRQGGGKRGVRIVLLSSPTKPLLEPKIDLDLGLSFSVPGVDPNPAPLNTLGKHCPLGDACSSLECLLMHPCPGFNCHHYGRTWLPIEHFKRTNKRYKQCLKNAAVQRQYANIKNPINNPIYNPINNPINGPINSLKRKTERREDAEEWLLANGRTGVMSNSARMSIMLNLASDRTLFNKEGDSRLHGKSIDDLFAMPNFSGYFGETMRSLEEEGLRFLTERGSQFHQSGKNRPVLAWAPTVEGGKPTLITQGQAKARLGFNSVFLWKNEEKPNTTYIEDLLQQRVHSLGLPRRLHRRCGMGDNGFGDLEEHEDEEAAVELHKVYLTYSFDVHDAIEKGNVVVVK